MGKARSRYMRPVIQRRSRAGLLAVLAICAVVYEVVGVVFISTAPAHASSAPTICANVPPQQAVASGPRIRHLDIQGTPTSVLLPPDYFDSSRRYPVLYLLHGGTAGIDSFPQDMNLVSRTATPADDEQFIVVTPYGGLTGFYLNWADHSHDYETRIITQVIPAIDRTYRTIATRKGRAVAGVSMGGWGAMHYSSSHPDLFGAAGSLSGGDDNQSPDAMAIFLLGTETERQCEDGIPAAQVDPFGMFGNPVTDEARWRAANPVTNASQFRGMDVYLTAGTGVPCDGKDRRHKC